MKRVIQEIPRWWHDYLAELARVTQRFREPLLSERPAHSRPRASHRMRESSLVVLVCLAVLFSNHAFHSAANAQSITCRAHSANRFFGNSPTNGDFFGTAVALSGNVAVVGAPDEDNACPEDLDCNSGAAYVFQWNGAEWVKAQQILPSDGATADRFGFAVAVDGNRIVVGAPQCTPITSDPCGRTGVAYVFEFDADAQAWLEAAKLTPTDGQARDRFGEAVALSGDVLLIGAPGADGLVTNGGAAYVYRFSPGANVWMLEDRLISSDPAFRYAESLAVGGDVAVIGAAGDDSITPGNPLCMTGSAFVYGFNAGTGEWIELQKLIASDAFCMNVGGSQFGTSVAMDGKVIVIGAEADDHAGTASGSAYAFRFDGPSGQWMEEQKLVAGDAAEDAFFGHAVSVSGDVALIGAPGRSFGPSAAGAAYLIRRAPGGGWFLNSQTKLEAATVGQGSPDYFGGALAMDGDRAWFGARNEGDMGPQAGAAYAVRGLISDCNTNGTADLCDIAMETSADCNGNGVPDECDIASDFSLDLDENGVPDECDPDCNGNTIPDVLDIASAFSTDCNRNGLPDECESDLLETTMALPNPLDTARFGFAVDIKGDVAVVGAPFEDQGRGAAYVYRYDGLSWVPEAKLIASDGTMFDRFGSAVAIDGSFLAVGSLDASTTSGNRSGAVYVFEYGGLTNGWIEQPRLISPTYDPDAFFGGRLSIDGDTLLISAAGSGVVTTNAGAAYVFRRDVETGNWNEENLLTADDAAVFDVFGESVALRDGIAVVGSYRDAVYIFRHDTDTGTWSQEKKLNSPEPGNRFGFSVAAEDARIVVGAYRSSTDGVLTGAAFVYGYDPIAGDWIGQQRLVPADASSGDLFGRSVAISQDTVVVSAPSHDQARPDAGAVYVFRHDDASGGWTVKQKWTAPDAEPGDFVGEARALAVSGGLMVVGAPQKGMANSGDRGTVFLVAGVAGGDALPPRGCEQCATFTIADPDQTPDDEFGQSVAMAAGWLAVGASEDDEFCPIPLDCNAGAVHLYRTNGSGWVHVMKLAASDPRIAAQFGWSLAMEPNVLLIGARYQDGFGTAYVFHRTNDTWVEEAKLSAPDGEVGDEIGFAVALSGDVAVLGNPEDADLGNRTGAAYVFRRGGDTWSFEQRLTASDRGPGESFGRAVAVDGDTIAVGVPEKDHFGELNVGTVYFYQYDTNSGIWMEQPALLAPDIEASAAFGQALALRGDHLLVGAPLDGPAGAAYTFRRNGGTWAFLEKLQPGLNPAPGADFGTAVALSDGMAFIGAPMERSPETTAFQGAIYAYYLEGTGWRGLTKYSPFDAAPPHNFGAALAADGDLLVGGSPRMAAYVADMHCHRQFISDQIRPRFLSIEIVGNGVLVRWQGRAGVTYDIEQATSIDGSWQLFDTVTATGAIQDFMHAPPATGSEQTFYRLLRP